jgi:hypothetical protein
MTERYIYRCAVCGNAGENFLPVASADGDAAACTTCGGPVTRDDGSPWWFESNGQLGPDRNLRARSEHQLGPDGELSAQYVALWWDESMSASFWWDSENVEPEQATQLHWQIDPLKDPDGTPVDKEDLVAYRTMLHKFKAAQKKKSGPITLAQWLDIAKQERLRYKSWIDDSQRARAAAIRAANNEAAGADHWTVHARQIADELDLKDEKAGAWSSLKDMARRVAEIATERGIQGPQGPLTAGNILREALQGGMWKRPNSDKKGKSGTRGE